MPDNRDDPEAREICSLCGEPIDPDELVWDKDGLPYHQGCWDEQGGE